MGRQFGFIHEKIEIKILILFIMRRLSGAVSQDALAELALFDGGFSYFDFSECLDALVKTGHISVENNLYSLTEKGRRNGETTENSLPFSVQKHAENAAAAARASMARDAMIKTMHTANDEGGYTAVLTMSDGLGVISKMELFVANEKQAKKLERGYRKNAEKIYNELIKMMLG